MQTSFITDIQTDTGCAFNRTVLHSFGNLLVFIFYSQSDEVSKQFIQNINNSIPIFGEYDNVKYYSLSTEKCQNSVKKFEVQKIPSIIFTQNDKKLIDRYDGEDIGTIFDMIDKISKEYKTKFEEEKKLWHPKVKSILESCPFLVFIKGTPSNPKCGFTKSLLEILQNHQIEYTYYDISADGAMGDWTRNYSKWLTFPQLYINGKIIGGLDVTKGLIEKGQFQKMIPGSCRKNAPQQRYQKFIEQHETIIFVDGFSFQNKTSQLAIQQAKKKYGEQVTIYNMAINKNLKNYITQNVCKTVPFVVHSKIVVKN